MEQDLFRNTPAASDGELPPQADRFPVHDRDLPPVIREVVMNAPESRKIPCFIACLSPLCALATRVRLKYYYDSRPSALLLQVLIEGSQSVGKSFAADIERLIMDSTLKARDMEQRRMEQLYREKRRTRKANEKLEEEPRTTIRVIPATISKTVLTRRADFYERILGDTLTFWMFAEELDQVTDAGRQGYSNLRTIMRTAYDFGSKFGMDYASDNSYSAIVDINICSMFCTTPAALDDYMDRKAIEGGNITRCIRCEITDTLGADGAIFKPYTQEQTAAIDSMLKKLMAGVYTPDGALQPEFFLDMSWLDSRVRSWCQAKGHEASLSGSVATDVFRKRASVSAFRCAALCHYLYLLDGTDENRARSLTKRIYLFMAEYILHSLTSRWGSAFEELNRKRSEQFSTGSVPGLYELCPDEFTRDQLKALAKQQGRSTPVRQFIYNWQKSGDIVAVDGNRFRKKVRK